MTDREKVVSLELAKKMKELGWDYETERSYIPYYNAKGEKSSWELICKHQGTIMGYSIADCQLKDKIFAPDAIEIGERLPLEIKKDKLLYLFSSDKFLNGWSAYYYTRDNRFLMEKFGKTEAEARGKMWIYLKEKGL